MSDGSANLTRLLARDIPQHVRARADKYLSDRRTACAEWSGNYIAYRVRGFAQYFVDLSRDPDAITIACSCPYFEDRGPCKHIWAVAVVIDQDPRWDGSWLESNPTIAYDTGDIALEEEPEDDGHWAGAFAPVFESPSGRGHKPPKPIDPVTAAAQAAVNRLAELRHQLEMGAGPRMPRPIPPPGSQLIFIIDADASKATGLLAVHAATRTRVPEGRAPQAPAKPLRLSPADVFRVADKADRDLVALLTSAAQSVYYSGYPSYGTFAVDDSLTAVSEAGLFGHRHEPMSIPPSFQGPVLAALCESDRAFLFTAADPGAYHKLQWDARPWAFRLEIVADTESPFPAYTLTGVFVRGEARMALGDPVMVLGSGHLVTTHTVAPLDPAATLWWVTNLRRLGPLRIPLAKADELLADVLSQPGLPPLDVPDELRFDEPDVEPVPVLTLHPDPNRYQTFSATLAFDYGGARVERGAEEGAIYRRSPRSLIRRKRDVEAAADEALRAHRVRFSDTGQGRSYIAVPFKTAPALVRELAPKGWRISVDDQPFRVSGDTALEVGSGIDWFDISGMVDFDGITVPLPELLAAVRRGDTTVVLPDKSIGVLTDTWLAQYGGLSAFASSAAVAGSSARAGAATDAGGGEPGLRVRAAQLGLVDALLASGTAVVWRGRALDIRDRLRGFEGIVSADPPASFVGTLRGYQRLGLGWLRFLQDLSLGGCLADDMGLGKTVTVLALLDQRRSCKEGAPRASLVVVPRSLLFNWKREAERFAPELRVDEYHGAGRDDVLDRMGELDLVLTTYGTMRRDAAALAAVPFDYVILDEAQAIKNAATASAKATRTLNGRHRLALSGTPIENQLGDLWSLFEFLNPGVLGSLQHGLLARARKGDEVALDTLRRGLRPFILRRTKAQVAPELPSRNEDTMLCELEPPERRLYNQLRDHYRRAVLGLVESQGLQRSRFQILEALLRLRQAACHPGLIDPNKHGGSSSKLDALLERLDEARAEGHKALVFSQFTSLLAFVRAALDHRGLVYEYLDGHTRDRERRVARFQEDPACPLFLVSLKAGGLGLNLTAADYVFLLDPWWNPAVEAQAIDRAHRIGQDRPVFAYRLISADTVEERIVELQARKRSLADAIITADNSGLAGLTREDLELLLQ